MKNKKLARMLAGIHQNYNTAVAQQAALDEALLTSAKESLAVASAVNDFLLNADELIESGPYSPEGDYAQAAADLREGIRTAMEVLG
ncbi:hypothetical protein ARTHRO9AX_210079 [Arthrobacter sp. 9AX]|uniref:hypothetical protein n=1 Tax=Arthrobacter sp. 9AX TaxID=2653131 RepID=UPI0012F419AE|nr:hypothetical protein [Arthrobacter sp. 9AX]VXC03696.1 hypothetical protein ARTHRO9AX_210079 [Arthrobacter sp. 9AX]